MNKTLAFAGLLLSACAEPEITVAPERGDVVGVAAEGRVVGVVRGVAEGRVVLGNDRTVRAGEIANGGFAFDGVADGTYFVKLEVAGFATTTETVTVARGAARVVLTATPLAGNVTYAWDRDGSRGGHEQGSAIGSARTVLRSAYGIELSDEDLVWSDEHAARLLHTLRAVPQPSSTGWAPVEVERTTWVLSDVFTRGDVVRVPASAFATGKFVSAQLHALIVSDVTKGGRDRAAVDRILLERYGVRAWLFDDAEILELIGMLEDMPAGLRSMPALKTIIWRAEGPPVRASVAEAALEISELAFRIDRGDALYDLVREKARFVVTPALQATYGDAATAIADYVLHGGEPVSGLEPQAIETVGISIEGRRVTVELGVDGASASVYVFDQAGRYALLSLNPATGGMRGSVTLPRAGSWRPDLIVVRDSAGVPTVRDISEVGWQLEVQ